MRTELYVSNINANSMVGVEHDSGKHSNNQFAAFQYLLTGTNDSMGQQ